MQVVPALERLLKSQSSDLVLVAVVRQLALSLCGWFNSSDQLPIAVAVWNELEEFLSRSLIRQTSHEDSTAFQRAGLIMSTLLDPNMKCENSRKPNRRNVCRIRFAEAASEDVSTEPSTTVENPTQDHGIRSENFCAKAVELSVEICRKALLCGESNECRCCLHLLALLMQHDQVSKSFLTAPHDSSFISANPAEMVSQHIVPLMAKFPDAKSAAALLFTALNYIEPSCRY